MRKFINEIFLTIAVVFVLTLICVVTVYDNSKKHYMCIAPRYDTYGNLIKELNYVEVYVENDRGKTLSYVVFNRPEDEEIDAKYQEFFGADPHVLSDLKSKKELYQNLIEEYGDEKEAEKQWSMLLHEHAMRWKKAQELAYEDRVDCFLSEMNCYEGDIIFKKGILDETIILYATNEELEEFRNHSYVKRAGLLEY